MRASGSAPCSRWVVSVTRVIVVDDQELVRTGFAMILEKAGLEVVGQAADGQEGVALARSTGPTWC